MLGHCEWFESEQAYCDGSFLIDVDLIFVVREMTISQAGSLPHLHDTTDHITGTKEI